MKTKYAKNPETGLYFNGTNFSAMFKDAQPLSEGITAESFRLSWGGSVVIEEVEDKPSLALRIYRGEITKYQAAREFIREMQLEGEAVSLRLPSGQTVTRKIKVPASSNLEAFVNYARSQWAVVWKNGELAIDLP